MAHSWDGSVRREIELLQHQRSLHVPDAGHERPWSLRHLLPLVSGSSGPAGGVSSFREGCLQASYTSLQTPTILSCLRPCDSSNPTYTPCTSTSNVWQKEACLFLLSFRVTQRIECSSVPPFCNILSVSHPCFLHAYPSSPCTAGRG